MTTNDKLIIPYEIVDDLRHKDRYFAMEMYFAMCDYYFKGIKPQHLTEEQNEYFQKVLPMLNKQIKNRERHEHNK